jgi:hypothetical protein
LLTVMLLNPAPAAAATKSGNVALIAVPQQTPKSIPAA